MTWPPKFAVCHSYYDRFRFRSDAFAGLYLALQIKGVSGIVRQRRPTVLCPGWE